MAKKKIAEETKQEFKLICTSINNKDKTIPVCRWYSRKQ